MIFLKHWFSQQPLSLFLGGYRLLGSTGCHFHFRGLCVHTCNYTLLLLTPTHSTPPLTASGGAPEQRKAVLHKQGTWTSPFFRNPTCTSLSSSSQNEKLQGALSPTWSFYKHLKTSYVSQSWTAVWNASLAQISRLEMSMTGREMFA